jgi:hypothetical protein
MASLDPKHDKLHRALNMITEAVGILQNSPRSSQNRNFSSRCRLCNGVQDQRHCKNLFNKTK